MRTVIDLMANLGKEIFERAEEESPARGARKEKTRIAVGESVSMHQKSKGQGATRGVIKKKLVMGSRAQRENTEAREIVLLLHKVMRPKRRPHFKNGGGEKRDLAKQKTQ